VDSRLFHNDEAESISEALRRPIRQITEITLTSETPMVEKVLTTDDVVLRVLVVLSVLLTVLNIDDNIFSTRTIILILLPSISSV